MKKITKLIICFFILCLGIKAQAKELTYYHMFSKNTPTLPRTILIVDNLKQEWQVDFRPGLACSAKTTFDNDKKPAIVEFTSGRYWQSLLEKDHLCDFEIKDVKWLAYSHLYYNLCVPINSKINNVNDFLMSDSLVFVIPDGSHLDYWRRSFNKSYNKNFKGIIVANSGAVGRALISGDADIGFMTSTASEPLEKNNAIKCLAYGEPNNQKSMSKLFDKIPSILNTTPISQLFGVKNVTEDEYKKIIEIFNKGQQEAKEKLGDRELVTISNISNSTAMEAEINKVIFEIYENIKKQK